MHGEEGNLSLDWFTHKLLRCTYNPALVDTTEHARNTQPRQAWHHILMTKDEHECNPKPEQACLKDARWPSLHAQQDCTAGAESGRKAHMKQGAHRAQQRGSVGRAANAAQGLGCAARRHVMAPHWLPSRRGEHCTRHCSVDAAVCLEVADPCRLGTTPLPGPNPPTLGNTGPRQAAHRLRSS